MLITFEGIEGSGKSTQISRVVQALSNSGRDVIATVEPGGTELGLNLRSILLDSNTGSLDPLAELFLFSAARSELLFEVIKPAIADGKIVLCDRFVDSTLAYQGYGRGLEIEMVAEINRTVCAGVWPNLTIWLDLPVDVGLNRAIGRLNQNNSIEGRFEKEDVLFHTRVQDGFKSIAKQEPDRVKRVDSCESIENVSSKIIQLVNEAIS